jgi:hypothetical protein
MGRVPVPHFEPGRADSHTERSRAGQLLDLAAAGDIDAIANFDTTRSGSVAMAQVADYRDALLAAAQGATAAQASAAVSAPLPPPPAIPGTNRQNSALLAAERKVRLLHAAAQRGTPEEAIAAIMAIPTSRGNNYLNAADNYKQALLLHFGRNAAGVAVPGVALGETAAAAPAPAPAAAPAPARPRRVTSRARREPAAPATPATPAVPQRNGRPVSANDARSMNPAISSNPRGLTEQELGFIPRPAVPLTTSTLAQNLPAGFVWPHPEMAEQNRRYLSQSTDMQQRARAYQGGTWSPPVPETPADRAAREQRERAAAAAEQQRIRDAALAAERANIARTAAFQGNRAGLDSFWRPRAQPGANIRGEITMTAPPADVVSLLGANIEDCKTLFKEMVADYAPSVKFSVRVYKDSYDPKKIFVEYKGSDGTLIRRKFFKDSDGKLCVYHDWFEAGATGEGSGKGLFRTSMGVYKSLGVKEVTVTAGLTIGGYAWARYGYKPKDWDEARAMLSSRLDSLHRRKPLTDSQMATMRALLASNDPYTLWKISDANASGRKVGKEIMLGSCWGGRMPLDDVKCMTRLKKYVAQGA